jgi:hypothetical protein
MNKIETKIITSLEIQAKIIKHFSKKNWLHYKDYLKFIEEAKKYAKHI